MSGRGNHIHICQSGTNLNFDKIFRNDDKQRDRAVSSLYISIILLIS